VSSNFGLCQRNAVGPARGNQDSDSSVYKGGMRHQYHLDYRGALRNAITGSFTDKVMCPSGTGAARAPNLYANGAFWKLSLETLASARATRSPSPYWKLYRGWISCAPSSYEAGFCRMALEELIAAVESDIHEDAQDPIRSDPSSPSGIPRTHRSPDRRLFFSPT